MSGDVDRRRSAPAVARNRGHILEVLRRVLPARGHVLEVASGTGEHAVFFAASLPGLAWHPSDADTVSLESIEAWRQAEGTENLLAPVRLDAASPSWAVGRVDAVFCANMVHISPWESCLGLLAGASRHLREGGRLVLYGPYRLRGRHTAPSNEAFDADLRSRNPAWGVRDLEAVLEAALAEGLDFEERVEMPANNQTVVLRRR